MIWTPNKKEQMIGEEYMEAIWKKELSKFR